VAGAAAGAGGAAALALRERAVALALVSAHVEQGEYRPARRLLAEAAAQGPVSLALALVRLHLTFGATEAAEEALAQSTARGAPEGAVELHRGFVALAKGQHAAAAERFAAVLDKARAPPAAPSLAHARRVGRRGVRCRAGGAARSLIRARRRQDPGHTTAATNLSLCLLYTKQLSQAVETLEKARARARPGGATRGVAAARAELVCPPLRPGDPRGPVQGADVPRRLQPVHALRPPGERGRAQEADDTQSRPAVRARRL